MDEIIGFGLYQSSGDRGSVGHVSVFWLRWCGWCRWGVGRGLGQGSGAVGWCYVCVSLDSLAGPGICVLCLVDTCTSEVHPVFNPVVPYGYLLSDMYLFMTFLFRVVGPGLVSTSPAFVSNSASGSACPKNGKSGPHCWGWGGSTQFAQQFEFAVTAPPLVGCVVWSLFLTII